jgi:streptogramin lyase
MEGQLESRPAGAPPASPSPAVPPATRLPGEPPPPFILEWGSNGTGDGEFNIPRQMVFDASGNIYVVDSFNHRIQKFDSSGTFITKWGSNGTGDGEFDIPVGIAIDLSGSIYVVDIGNDRIQKFDSSGTFLSKWGTTGTGDGEFSGPIDIAIDTSGIMYVTDYVNRRVQKLDSSGTFILMWGWGVAGGTGFEICTSSCQAGISGAGDGQFAGPEGVAVDLAGNVYVTDGPNFRMQKFDGSGRFITKWGTSGTGDGQFDYPTDVTVDASGHVYVADIHNFRIQKFDGSGVFFAKWGTFGTGAGQFSSPQGVAVDATGNVYVGDTGNHRIQKFGPPFETLLFLTKQGSFGMGNGQFDEPWGVALDAEGNVYVADTNNDRIQKLDENAKWLANIGTPGTGDGELNYPTDVAIDATGNIYVSDTFNDRIEKFNKHGAFVKTWGSSGSGAGKFGNPTGVTVDAVGNVYVSDRPVNRLQKFDSNGVFQSMWGWGVDDGTSEFQICTSLCQIGISGTGDGQFNNPHDLAVNAAGDVYVADTFNHRIQKFDSDGTFLTKWGSYCDTAVSGVDGCDGQFDRPSAVAFDAAGNVYVSDWNNSRVQKFDSNGNFITKWGLNGTGDAEFDGPSGIAVDPYGNVYVADYGNHDIQKFGPCRFSAAPATGLLGFAGGAATFDVDTNGTLCGWAVTPNHPWITVTSGDEGLGSAAVGYSVDPNPTAVSRGGSIAIADRSTGGPGYTFPVLQDPAPCTYGLSSSSASFSGTAGADFVSVTSLLGCAWTAVSNDGWISVDAGSPGTSDGVVLYSVSANAGSAVRSGSMTIAGSTFTVNQDPQVPDAAPSNLACTAVNSTKIKMSWTDNAANEAWLKVERKIGAGGAFAQITVLPPDTTGYTDTGLTGHTEYVYRVMACNPAGCSAPSAEVSETTPALGVFVGEEPGRY